MPAPNLPIAQSADQVPPGQAALVVPHEQTFSAIYNLLNKTYSWQFDEALFDNVNNAIAMRFDPVIMEPLETRMRATALQTWHLEPEDEADDNLVEAAAAIEKRIRRMPRMQDFLMTLQDALWYGRAGVNVVYEWWRDKDGRLGIVPKHHLPINGDKLVFKYTGEVGIRVSGVYQSGTTVVNDYGRVHFFTEEERQAVVVHQYRPEDADYLRPRKAGLIKGVGLRERLYWFWAIKNQVMGLLMDYLRWFAQGITIYYYEMGNEAARLEVSSRAKENIGQPFLLFPRERTGEPNYKPIERFDPSTASTNLMTELITKWFDEVIRRMILGTSGTTLGGPTGLGSDTASVLERTASSVIKYDSNGLADTLTLDFVSVVNAWTYPGYPTPRWVFDLGSPNVEQLISAGQFFTDLGGELGAETTRKMLGLPAVRDKEAVLGRTQPMQPAAVDGLPEGVPVVTGDPQGAGDPSAGQGSVMT